MKKNNFFDKNQIGEIVAELEFSAADKKTYKCVGVITHEDDKTLKISFSAKNSVVVDFLEVNKDQITKFKVINKSEICFI